MDKLIDVVHDRFANRFFNGERASWLPTFCASLCLSLMRHPSSLLLPGVFVDVNGDKWVCA